MHDGLCRIIGRQTIKVQAGQQVVTPAVEANLPPGFYVLQLELNGIRTSQKLIKQ